MRIHQDSDWQKKKQVIKGNFAEDIINKFLEDKGYIVYNPTTPGAHAFDKVAIKDKRQVVIAECKAKAKRNKYDDTGIDYRAYVEYRNMQTKHKIPVFIFFIDEMLGKIYGNFITLLEKENTINKKNYPSVELATNGATIIYFPLHNMRAVANLNENEIRFLKEYSTRNYDYL